MRRHRLAVVAVASAALVAMIVVGVVSVWKIVDEKQRAETERSRAELERERARAGRAALLEAHGRAELLAGHAGTALAYLVGASSGSEPGGARGFLIADAMRPFEAEVAYREVGQGDVAIAVSPDGRYVASGGAGALTLWRPDGTDVRSFGEHGSIRVVAFDPTGTRIAAAGDDGVARVWTIEGTLVAELRGHDGPIYDAVFAPDGKSLVTTGNDATVRIWDLATHTSLPPSTCHTGAVYSARFSPDGQHVLTASVDASACIIDASTGHVWRQLKGHTARVHSATWSADGTFVVTASDDGTARVWTTEHGKLAAAPLKHRQGSTVESALVTPDRRVITIGNDGAAMVWQLPAALPEDGTAPPAAKLVKTLVHAGPIVAAALDADNTLLVTGGFDGVATVWDLWTGQPIATFEHADVVTTTRFIPGQPRLATASRDGTARVWNTQIAKARHELDSDVHALAVSHGVVAAGTDDSHVTLVRGDLKTVLGGHLGRVFAVAFTSDGGRLVSAGEDGAIVWDVARGVQVAVLGVHTEPIHAVAIAPDNDTVAMLVGTHVELWSLATRTKVRDLEGGNIEAIATAPRGGLIAGAGTDGTVVLWAADGRVLDRRTARSTPYTSVAFSPNGDSLVTAGMGVGHVWRVTGGRLGAIMFPLEGLTGVVRAVAFTADGTRIVTAGDDGRARIWDAVKGKLLATRDRHDVTAGSIALDGDTLWVGSQDGTLRAWDIRIELRPPAEIARFMQDKHVLEYLDEDDVVRRRGKSR